jgi:hypothetical protein
MPEVLNNSLTTEAEQLIAHSGGLLLEPLGYIEGRSR